MTLKINKINVALMGNHVLRDLTLEVRSGELVCLVGRNGAGKSTTFRSIMGYQPITSGEVRFRGQSLKSMLTNR